MLGVVTAVCVRLTPNPPAVRTMLLDFADVDDCARTVSAIVAAGVIPAAMEMMDRGIVRAVEAFAHAGYPTEAAAVLLIEVDGAEPAVDAQTAAVERAAAANGVGTVRIAADERRARPAVEGPQERVRGRSRRSPRTTTCTTAWCRARSSRRSSPASTRSRGATTSS